MPLVTSWLFPNHCFPLWWDIPILSLILPCTSKSPGQLYHFHSIFPYTHSLHCFSSSLWKVPMSPTRKVIWFISAAHDTRPSVVILSSTCNCGLLVRFGHLLHHLCGRDVLGKGFEVCSSFTFLSSGAVQLLVTPGPPVVERKMSCYVWNLHKVMITLRRVFK